MHCAVYVLHAAEVYASALQFGKSLISLCTQSKISKRLGNPIDSMIMGAESSQKRMHARYASHAVYWKTVVFDYPAFTPTIPV